MSLRLEKCTPGGQPEIAYAQKFQKETYQETTSFPHS
jgi:hypothetical protein